MEEKFELQKEWFKNLLSHFGSTAKYSRMGETQIWESTLKVWNGGILSFRYFQDKDITEAYIIFPESDEFMRQEFYLGYVHITENFAFCYKSQEENISVMDAEEIFRRMVDFLAPHLSDIYELPNS